MFTLLENIIRHFGKYTKVWDTFTYLNAFRIQIFTVLFLLAILLGFYCFRLFFAALFFYVFVCVSTFLLSPITSWRNTVAFFSVFGVIFTFLAFRWNRVASITVCAAVGALVCYFLLPSLISAAVGAILAGVLAFLFPVASLCFFIPLFGTMGVCELLSLSVWVGVVLFVVGIILQWAFSQNQILFPKPYPDWFAYRLQKRRERHATGI